MRFWSFLSKWISNLGCYNLKKYQPASIVIRLAGITGKSSVTFQCYPLPSCALEKTVAKYQDFTILPSHTQVGIGGDWVMWPLLFDRGVDSSHATWTRVGLESLFLWLVTWLGLAKKWLATWLGLAKKWLVTWLGLARKWLVTNASQKLLERPRDLINFKNRPRPKKVCFRFTPPPPPRKPRQNLPYLEFV